MRSISTPFQILISISLLFSLFIYVFYRTEHTVVNELFIQLISLENYRDMKLAISNFIPLHGVMVYSVPGGLWVFGLTLASRHYYLRISKLKISLITFPLWTALSFEVIQFFGLSQGQFDLLDILFAVLFWAFAIIIQPIPEKQIALQPMKESASRLCLAGYAIVFLACVSH
ncbi:MAG: hypothetical protein EP338_08255 [Bacteroidetes bacterium]|nr:MAG: hypothetical protein EP338_08255 [Bacteroidota bacterium]